MRIGIIGNTRKSRTPGAIARLVDILRGRGLPYVIDNRVADTFEEVRRLGDVIDQSELPAACDAVFAFGGDGTMLSAGRLLAGSNVPVVGVNLGKLGFLAEFSVDDLSETVTELAAGRCPVVERSLLEARFPENPDLEPLTALNDIVIDKRETRLLITLETYINDEFLASYVADGLIISTPTGSTAYALAVGGPVVTPNAGVTVIAPIAPHMLTARPVVVPDRSVITVVPQTDGGTEDSVHVFADGQNHHYLHTPTKVVVTRYEHTVRLVKKASRSYFDVLRAKLLWGAEPRSRNTSADEGSIT